MRSYRIRARSVLIADEAHDFEAATLLIQTLLLKGSLIGGGLVLKIRIIVGSAEHVILFIDVDSFHWEFLI